MLLFIIYYFFLIKKSYYLVIKMRKQLCKISIVNGAHQHYYGHQ